MLLRIKDNSENIFWLGLVCAALLWLVAICQTGSLSLSLTAPFTQLGISFWTGLLLTTLIFLLARGRQRLLALVLLALYFVATLSFMYPYAVMHDSVINALVFPQGENARNIYGQSYIGFGSLIAFLVHLSGTDTWTVARFFPAGMTVVYLLTIGLIAATWRNRLFSSSFSTGLFIFFFFVFGDVFYLRINPSPQTLGFLMFLVAMGLLPISNRSIVLRGLLIMTLGLMIILHPITPLLALPALLVSSYLAEDADRNSIRRIITFAGTFLIGYSAWTLYRADWVLSSAVRIIVSAFTAEKRIPIVDSPVIPQIELYVYLHRILLISVLFLLVLAFFSLWRRRVWLFVAAWGIALIPGFVVLYSYRDFFDRIMLFLLFPAAVVFAEAGDLFWKRFSSARFRILTVAILTGLTLLSASVAYFGIGAVDRVTGGELAGLEYLISLSRPVTVYANGFNIPLSNNLMYVPAVRGSLHFEDLDKAEAVVVSQQMINAILLNPQPEHSLDELNALLDRDFQEVYTNGETRVYLRKNSQSP